MPRGSDRWSISREILISSFRASARLHHGHAAPAYTAVLNFQTMQLDQKLGDEPVEVDRSKHEVDASETIRERPSPVHVLPRRVEVKWGLAIYVLMFTAGTLGDSTSRPITTS